MKSTESTPASAHKSKRNYLADYLPLYKKLGESYEDTENREKSPDKHGLSSKKKQYDSPKHQRPPHEKQPMEVSQITIDGSNLSKSVGSSTHLNESKVTTTPLSNKKPLQFDKVKSKNNSLIGQGQTMDDVSVNLSKSTPSKRSKSVSFVIEDNEHGKKLKSDILPNTPTGDTPLKAKNKHKKSQKENKNEEIQMTIDEPVSEVKNKKSKTKTGKPRPETQVQTADDETGGDSVLKHSKFKKLSQKVKKEKSTIANVDEKTKKAKKKKHQSMSELENDGEPTPKSPKTEAIADNLENLTLGDNSHTLTNLIDEMAVVDKRKQKKLRKTANKETKEESVDINQNQDNIVSDKDGIEVETKKWVKKRWNKHQVAKRDQNTTINIDNLPVSLLKGNFKKILIDHFSKYGLSRSVGEPIIQNEEDINAVFTTKVFFDTVEAAAEALEMDETTVAGNEIQVSQMRPLTETAIVIRIYGAINKLNTKDVVSALGEAGLIRNVRPLLKKKNTMSTILVEFDAPETVKRALEKCANLTINGAKIKADNFVIINNENKEKATKKRKRQRSNKKKGVKDVRVDNEGAPDQDSDSDSDDE